MDLLRKLINSTASAITDNKDTVNSTYFAGFAVNDGDVFPILREPLTDIYTELSDEF